MLASSFFLNRIVLKMANVNQVLAPSIQSTPFRSVLSQTGKSPRKCFDTFLSTLSLKDNVPHQVLQDTTNWLSYISQIVSFPNPVQKSGVSGLFFSLSVYSSSLSLSTNFIKFVPSISVKFFNLFFCFSSGFDFF